MTIPSEVWAALASAFVVITAMLGIGWFRDLSARVRHLEEMTVEQAEQINCLKLERQKLRERLHKYGIDEESEPYEEPITLPVRVGGLQEKP